MYKINWPVSITESKYSLWYEELITNSKNRTSIIEGYVERHHIIPTCMFKDNSEQNLVILTAREHYIAHALLWKMTMSAKWHNKMTMALHVMVNGSGNQKQDRSYKINSRIYESNRIAYCKYLSDTSKGKDNHFYGKKHTEETKEKIRAANERTKETRSANLRGEKNGMYGKIHTLENRKQISETCKKYWNSEKREEQSRRAIEFWKDPELLEKRRQLTTDRWKNMSPEKKAEILEKGASKRRGAKRSAETKKKISEARIKGIKSGKIVPWNKGKTYKLENGKAIFA